MVSFGESYPTNLFKRFQESETGANFLQTIDTEIPKMGAEASREINHKKDEDKNKKKQHSPELVRQPKKDTYIRTNRP